MIYLHKLIPLIFSPIMIVIVLILYGSLRRKTNLILVVIATLYVFSTPIVARSIFRFTEASGFRMNPLALPRADAIVVLSGMLQGVESFNGLAYEWSDPDRFFAGLELFRLGKASNVIFTRGTAPWHNQLVPEGDLLRNLAISLGVPPNMILLTELANNTEEESKAVRRLFNKIDPKIILVTSAYHMSRSVYLFERQGFDVTPFPVDFQVDIRSTTLMDFLPDSKSLVLLDLSIREQLGRGFYRMKYFFQDQHNPY